LAIFTLRFYLFMAILFLLGLGGSMYFLHQMNKAVYQKSLQEQVESALWYAQEAIESRKRTALSISLILSSSPAIIEAYKKVDREKVFDEVQNYLESMSTFEDLGQIDVQFHTRDLKSWVRSWDKDSFGLPLGSFRKGLVHVKQTQAPHVSIELGKRLNIKAISPIFIDGTYGGSVEAIVGFEGISKSLIKKGIEFVVLLQKDFLDIAEWERTKNRIEDYILISETCPCKKSLEIFAKEHKFGEGFLEDDVRAYGFLPLFNVDATPLGFFGVAFRKDIKREDFAFLQASSKVSSPIIVPNIQSSIPSTKVEIR
jgi:hypothetical protein